eukprot:CAMPEP_0174729140 /NCGR_PEP_ID=MMETSP1094-20130205/53104_1 /TAXON_ID=156173 /ORGANISM="Chrysochromulina brevifilum, Strain UTEX LB 985" /LENGTH=35 /DNA_ID= /DNA_START= /DNA_END= /DNA_ORIENTATION=
MSASIVMVPGFGVGRADGASPPSLPGFGRLDPTTA